MRNISIQNLAEVQEIVLFVRDHVFDLHRFLNVVHGDVSTQKINEEQLTTIVSNVSDTIATIVVGSVNSKIKSIVFYGLIPITPKDVFQSFGKFREAYSFRDDLYFYFFNEANEQGSFRLSFFEPSHNKVDVPADETGLSNLFIAWP